MPVGYTYITTSQTGWVYGGKRESSTFDDKYYGSGKVVQQHLAKYGNAELLSCEVVLFYETYEELYDGERALIAELRSVYGSQCVNILDGGEGWTSKDSKEFWNKKDNLEKKRLAAINQWRNEEVRKRNIAGIKNALSTPEARKRASTNAKMQWKKPDVRKRNIEAIKKALSTSEARKIKSDIAKKIGSSEDYRFKMSQSMKRRYANDEARRDTSDAMKLYWQNNNDARLRASERAKIALSDLEVRKRISEETKKALSKPEVRSRKSEAMKIVYQNPEARKLQSEKAKAAWARRKAAQQQALVSA